MKTVKMLNGETKYFEEVNGELVEVERKGRFTPYYNEDYLIFQEMDGRIITINPTHWGSVEVYKHD